MKNPRIFLDANILFSAAYGSPSLQFLWDMCKQGEWVLLASRYVVDEAQRNLSSVSQQDRLTELLLDVILVSDVDPSLPCMAKLPDKDRPVLLAAIQSKATFLLTGDLRHFGKYRGKTFQGVTSTKKVSIFLSPARQVVKLTLNLSLVAGCGSSLQR